MNIEFEKNGMKLLTLGGEILSDIIGQSIGVYKLIYWWS